MKIFSDSLCTRFRIRNSITGAYIHRTLLKPMIFYDRLDALAYIKRHELNPEIYFVEVVK